MAVRFILGAAALGAVTMFMLDPAQGRRRRAVAHDRFTSGLARVDDAAGVAARDLKNRARGVISELRASLNTDDVPDDVVAERVRSRLGRAVSHPGAIHVEVSEGRVILTGAVLEREYIRLLRAVWSVRGVTDAEDRLAVYETSDGVSALQGEGKPVGPRFELLQENWSPATRVLVGTTGLALLLHALSGRRRVSDLLTGAAGAAFVLRSATNLPLKRLVGARRPAVDIQKVIEVDAPLEQVFNAFSRYENFPQFMRNVRDVRVREDGTSQWSVAGPVGQTIRWEAMTTRHEPNRLIAWRTLPRSAVEHAGLVRFEPGTDGGTRVLITMSYTPPAGALGHAVAKLFGSDPKSELDEDLLRLKVFLETGKRPHDAAAARH
jgi:uncharacterized membrane protein